MANNSKESQATYAKKHYEANKEVYKARAVAHTKKTREAVKEFIISYLEEHPCSVCGETDIIVLEFDHRDRATKDFDIGMASARKFSLARVRAEVQKCDVLCANCHRKKTYVDLGWNSRTK